MRRDKDAPALYELVGAKPRPAAGGDGSPGAAGRRSSAPSPAPAPVAGFGRGEPGSAAPASWLSPGRVVRLPVGYLIGISLLFAALLVGAFVTGYNRRKAEEIRVREAEAVRELDQVVDPLALPAGGRSMPSSSERAPAETDAANSRRGSTGPTPNPQNRVPSGGNRPSTTGNEPRSGAAAPPPSPVQSRPAERERGVVVVTGSADDPRQPGLNYLIAATLPTDEAEKAADFLSSSGLEIALVPADNRPSLRWVVVLRGVAAKDLGGPTARALEQRLQDLGREYKQVHRGPTVFNDPWWKKHSR